MKTIAIFDDLENNREDYDNLMIKYSGANKIDILLNSYYENKKKKFFQSILYLKKKIFFDQNFKRIVRYR